jgi:hypothetical protein
VIECLLGNGKVLNSNPSISKKNIKRKTNDQIWSFGVREFRSPVAGTCRVFTPGRGPTATLSSS